MLAAIPPMIIIFSSIMKLKNKHISNIRINLSIFGVGTIISNADIQKIISLSFNKGYLDVSLCFKLVIIFNFT